MSAKGNILVTGGAGYIGAHACKALRLAGYTPVTYDNLERGHESAVRWGPLELGDLRDGERLKSALARYSPEAVMHFAAFAYVGESFAEPEKYYHNNVHGSLCLLESMRSTGLRRIIFSSTCATYGIPQTLPIDEDHIQRPVNPYGNTKVAVERMIDDYVNAYGFEQTTFRYFNAAGADPELEVGELHDPEPHLIPNALQASISEPLRIFGTNYPTPDGTCVRDYIHVSDIADAHVLGLTRLADGGKNACYNLGNDTGYSVLEVIAAVEQATGRRVPVEISPERPGDPPILVANSRRARSELGWNPRYPTLRDMVLSAWQWHKKISAS